jgi:MATE family multidrug resistance protein
VSADDQQMPAEAAGSSTEWKAITRLALPIALAQVGQVLMGIVDIKIVGKLGAVAIAAAAAGHGVAIVISLFIMGIAMGLDPIVAQRLGAKDEDGAWHAFGDCLRVALVVAGPAIALVALLGWVVLGPNLRGGHPIPAWLPMSPDVAEQAIAYTWARIPGVVPFMLFGAYRAWFYANHMTRPILVVTIWANVINAIFDYVFVYGDPGLVELGLPGIGLSPGGVAAAGAVTSAVNILSIVYLAPLAFRHRRGMLEAKGGSNRPVPGPVVHESRAAGMRRILRLGSPIGTIIVLEVGIFVLVGWRSGAFGPIAQAAQEIALKIASLTFMVTVGFGAAASVRVGRAIGAGSTAAARKSGFTALVLAFLWMAFCGAILVTFPRQLARLFSDDPAVIESAAPLLRVAALFQVFDGTQSAASGALRGAGDTRLPMLANLVAYWAVGLPIAEVLAFRCGMGPVGLWVGLTAALVVVAVLLTWRFHALTRRKVARVG